MPECFDWLKSIDGQEGFIPLAQSKTRQLVSESCPLAQCFNFQTILINFAMQEGQIKRKQTAYSDNNTANEDISTAQALSKSKSPHQKPQEDPDAPPEISLESDLQENKDCFSMEGLKEALEEGQLSKSYRARTKSQDNDYTIIGFLDKKVNNKRLMSEDMSVVGRQ